MKGLRTAGAAALIAVALAGTSHALRADESDPLPVPTGTPREHAVIAYNAGVRLLVEKRYAEAQAGFEAALALDERLAEAHNNLAFSLRMQGREHLARALRHYDRALELKPDLAQAYLYRGVLFTQMGDLTRARADYERLRSLDRHRAAQLEAAIERRAAGDGSAGVAPQYE